MSAIAHATEDATKVEKALRNILPDEVRKTIQVSRQYSTGHHGNPIVFLTVKIKEKENFENLAKLLAGTMSDIEKLNLENNLSERIDAEGNLYLRLDKQEALTGKLRLREDDPIRVRLKVANRGETTSSIAQTLRTLGFLR